MEVDPSPADPIAELSQILAQLDDSPRNVPYLRKAIDLMATLGLTSEQVDSMDKLSELVMLSESKSQHDMADVDQWQTYFDISLANPLTLDVLADVLERFDHAEQDYFSKF